MTLNNDKNKWGSGQELKIVREFNAPRDLVWKAFTQAEHLAKWWGPVGMKMVSVSLDLQPGGLFHYGMESPDGQVMWGKFVYHEISPQDRLVFISSFSDEHAGTSRHPMAPAWPVETINTLDFTEENGKTTVTLQGGPYHATEEEFNLFVKSAENVQQGFKGTMDQLEKYLQTL